MFVVAVGAWLMGVVVSWLNYNRKLPMTIFLLGAVVLGVHVAIDLDFIATVVIASLGIVIWIANRYDAAVG